MKDFLGLLKVFLEKHLIPTVIAIGIAILAIPLTNDEFFIKVKLGIFLYLVLVFCLSFILIQLLIKIIKSISNLRFKYQHSIKELAEAYEKLWSMVDNMSKGDVDYLRKFLNNNNAPINVRDSYYMNSPLFKSSYVHGTTVDIFIKQFKLTDTFYKMLKDSYEKYDKISHFE